LGRRRWRRFQEDTMTFFNAYRAVDVNVPIYFIESTAPNNVDDTDEISTPSLPHLEPIPDSDDAVRQIAERLAKGADPNLVVMVHGFNNARVDVLKTYTAAALAVDRDRAICDRQGVVCLGYRWPSEKITEPWRGTWDALPTLPTWILYLGIAFAALPFLFYYLAAEGGPRAAEILGFARHLVGDHVVTLTGLALAGLVLAMALLRVTVYFRDNYRASNYGVPDLIQIIRAIDREVFKLRGGHGEHDNEHPKVQLSFIGHSMGAFVVTNTIRTLSDVFVTPVESLNEFGVAGPVPHSDMQEIGNVFKLKRFVLVSPDIPAEALLSNRGNFLASSLSRFEEAYLFSNEGDEVLRQISTLANYFVFPTKSRNHGFRLGNVEILSSNFGLIDPGAGGGFLQTLRIGNLTLEELYDALDSAEASRQPNEQTRARAQTSLPEVFTYFDCTDYIDDDETGKNRPLLTFAKWKKRHDRLATMRFYSHLRLLLAYLLPGHRPDVHGGYFEGVLSQQLIYRLACLGFDETVSAFGNQAAFGVLCGNKQIRVLLSPCLRKVGAGPAAALLR
jgi:pimeloyl-ACP methyl ester carboxylesterase